jgi:hypothetical protein
MNRLMEYFAEHHLKRGEAFNIVLVSEIIDGSGFSLEEVLNLAMGAYHDKMVIVGRSKVNGDRMALIT